MRDAGHEGMRLPDFCARPEAAHLTIEHVLALRLYTCTPVSFALGEYCLNLQAQATEMVEYEAFGKTFYSARDGETASKQAKLASFDEMFACMALRSQARAIAGSFDIILN